MRTTVKRESPILPQSIGGSRPAPPPETGESSRVTVDELALVDAEEITCSGLEWYGGILLGRLSTIDGPRHATKTAS